MNVQQRQHLLKKTRKLQQRAHRLILRAQKLHEKANRNIEKIVEPLDRGCPSCGRPPGDYHRMTCGLHGGATRVEEDS